MTNIGTFRVWLEAWLQAYTGTHKGMTMMVRQLESDSDGLPVEIYTFSNTTAWLQYEKIQSDIFAVLPEFGLRVHQMPTGNDMRNMRITKADAERETGLPVDKAAH